MDFAELHFIFPQALTEEQLNTFIAYVQAIRDKILLQKARDTLFALKAQKRVTFGLMGQQNDSFRLQLEMIIKDLTAAERRDSSKFFVLGAVSETEYCLRLSYLLNLKGAKSRMVENLIAAMKNAQWVEKLRAEMQVESIKIEEKVI